MSFIMYLRKSRADNPDETVEEVLSKHERILQDFCLRQYGAEIPEADIYREVVSGESIADRVEIRKVLSRIEDSRVTGLIVVEPQRLSRGDLVDCGTLINALQYTNTRVITPIMTYDLANKFERRYFQDELLRGRDYLEYTKEILQRGRIASINRGNYLASIPPYGYDKVVVGKDHTLVPNSQADTVRMIFDLFCSGLSFWQIARRLDDIGIPTLYGNPWSARTIEGILQNRHYIGDIVYQRSQKTLIVTGGQKTAKRVRQKEGSYIIVPGKHSAIISRELFEKAQSLLSLHAPVKRENSLKNALAGLVYCAHCGTLMQLADRQPRGGSNHFLFCKTPKCAKAVPYLRMISVVADSLEEIHLPDLRARLDRGEETAAEIRKKMLLSLDKEIENLRNQEDVQYDLLEKRQYTPEIFARRNQILREKISAAELQREELARSIPEDVNYSDRVQSLTGAIRALRDDSISAEDQNLLLKTIIDRIDLSSPHGQRRGVCDFTLQITLKL